MSIDDKLENTNAEIAYPKNDAEIESEIDLRLKNIDKLDFSKIEESKENPDFDAHAGLD
jgi:hypothetical protein